MSVSTEILCDVCFCSFPCGAGSRRRSVHDARSQLSDGGWSYHPEPKLDFCRSCSLKTNEMGNAIAREKQERL